MLYQWAWPRVNRSFRPLRHPYEKIEKELTNLDWPKTLRQSPRKTTNAKGIAYPTQYNIKFTKTSGNLISNNPIAVQTNTCLSDKKAESSDAGLPSKVVVVPSLQVEETNHIVPISPLNMTI